MYQGSWREILVYVAEQLFRSAKLTNRVLLRYRTFDQHGRITPPERLAQVSLFVKLTNEDKLIRRYWTSADPDDPNSHSAMFFVVGYALVSIHCLGDKTFLTFRSASGAYGYTAYNMLSCTGAHSKLVANYMPVSLPFQS
jgi:hypothetical protein